MYDDDSEGDDAKVGRKVANSVKRVARGTRRMSLMAADNVKKVAKGVEGNVKKNLHELDGQKKKKKKKKKKKSKGDKKDGKKNLKKGIKGIKKGIKKVKRRGRSESPRRSTNAAEESKPPVTKSGASWKSTIAKKWRSVSPAMGRRGKKSKTDTVDGSEELEPLAPLPTFQGHGGGHDDGMNGSRAGYSQRSAGGSAQYASNARNQDVGESLRSLSSNARYERNQQQEKIQRDNVVPFFSKLLQSKHFVKYCDIAFDLVDSNGDEVVDETELYAGLLLIHLKLGSFLGPAGCKPLGRDRSNQMFRRFDTTDAGGLDRGEFRRIMMVLFGHTFARVFVQYTLTILIVPLVAKRVLDFLTFDSQRFWDYWTKPKHLRRMGEELTLKYYVNWNITSYPSSKRTFFTKLFSFIRPGSDEFWNTFPLTFMTILLGLVIAPFVLYYFDDAFQYGLDWKEKREKPTSSKKR